MIKVKQPPALDYVEVCTLFSNAEDKIKKVEHLAGGVIIPAVNQLRYAGQHLVRTLNGCNNPTEELSQSINHCKRASFDACEAGLLYCLDLFKQFQDDYRTVSVVAVLPDWLKYCATAREAQNLVQISQDGDRISSYTNAENALDELLIIVSRFPDAREELNKTLKNDRRNFKILLWTLIAAVVAAIITLLAYIKPLSISQQQTVPATKTQATNANNTRP